MQHLFETFVKPELALSIDDVIREANQTYDANLEAMVLQFHSMHTAQELDELLGGRDLIVSATRDCYEYAIHGRLKPAKTAAQAGDSSHDWNALAALILAARYGIEFFSPEVAGVSVGVPINLEQLFFHAILRARLDRGTLPELNEDMLPVALCSEPEQHLNLKEIAVLAQMHEKSVRNATQPTAPDRLFTRKEGTRTVVDTPEALRWLKGRRHFKPTVLV